MTRTEIIKELQYRGYDAELCETVKNGVVFKGIRIEPEHKAESNIVISPVIYTEDIIKRAELAGKNLSEVASEIESIFRERMHPDIQIENTFDRNYVLDNLYIRLQQSSDEKIIKKSSMFDGIESYLCVRLGMSDSVFSSFKVHEMYLKGMGIDENEAWEHAEENTSNESVLIPIQQMIMEMAGISVEDADAVIENDPVPMYVLTNKEQVYGASAIFNKNILIDFASQFHTDKIMMLPSSIHEVLLMPYKADINTCELTDMVQEINNKEVKPEERLADKAYIIEPFKDRAYAV